MNVTSTNGAWSALPEDIIKAAKHLADTGDYDAAIFAAFKLVEAEVQMRIGSTQIGKNLVDEAFGNAPKIIIGSPKDAKAVYELFAGASGHIRNDRGHKKGPAVPCSSERTCLWYLNTAALLLYLLSKDHALRPVVDFVTVHRGALQSRIDIDGRNLADVAICANGKDLRIITATSAHVEAELPADFLGLVSVTIDGEIIWEEVRDARQKMVMGVYEVLETEVPVFADQELATLRTDCVGIIVRVHEGGERSYLRISPVHAGQYKRGQYLADGPWDFTRGISQAWCASTRGRSEEAWTASMMWTPRIMAEPTKPALSGLDALPSSASVSPGDYDTLAALASERAGEARLSRDATADCNWESDDPNVAEVSGGRLRAIAYGNTLVRCKMRGFQAVSQVTVESHLRGQHAIVFEGLSCTSGMAFDSNDDLFITNQSESVYRLKRTGGVDVALRMAGARFRPYGYDCLALDASDALYITGSERLLMRSTLGAAGYETAEILGSRERKVRKSIAIAADGTAVVGVMGPEPGTGSVLQVSDEHGERSFATRDSAHNLVVGYDDHIYVSATKHQAIDVYDRNGRLIQSIDHPINSGIGAMCAYKTALYIGGVHSGSVLRVALDDNFAVTQVASGLGTISGLAIDSRGRLHVADFEKGRIQIVY